MFIGKKIVNVYIVLSIFFADFCIINSISYSKVKVEKFDGVLDWDKQSNYAEAKELMEIAKDINREKKRRKQLRDAGLSKEEISQIIKRERNGNINIDAEIEKRKNASKTKEEIENYEEERNEDDDNSIIINHSSSKLKNDKNTYKEAQTDFEEPEEVREVDLTIRPPVQNTRINYEDTNFKNEKYNSYDDFELSRMLHKAGDNLNNPANFAIYAKEVAKIANKEKRKTKELNYIPEIDYNVNTENNYEYDYNDEDDGEYIGYVRNKRYAKNDNKKISYQINKTKSNNKNNVYNKSLKNTYAINDTTNNKKQTKKNKQLNRFYANRNGEEGEEIYSNNNIVEEQNGISEKQIKAQDVGAQYPIKRSKNTHNTQYQPQNIAQIAYDKNNKHLQPAVFESHVINQVFDNLGDENAIQLARALINKVGQTDIADEDGNTLLMHAVARHNQSLIAMLLAEGANPNVLNKEGFSPIHLATSNGDDTAVYSLMMGGGNPNIRDADDNTPLMYASKTCNEQSVKMMMALGGDPTIANRFNGRTAIDFASENENHNVLQILEIKQRQLRKNKNPVNLTKKLI